jgi:hypothetical protein
MNKNLRPFHLAFPVSNLERTLKWYTEILGCSVGRQSDKWIDFNLYGHQIVGHLADKLNLSNTNNVDGEEVPIRHFGVILTYDKWGELVAKLKKENVNFLIKPQIRFKGIKGEQKTFFIEDPDGNALEFKAFKNDSNIFDH